MVPMPSDTGPLGPDGAPIQRKGRMSGYPGRADLLAAQADLRGALTALARDPDPQARNEGVRLAVAAAASIRAMANTAGEATTASKKLKARVERVERQLDRTLAARRNGKS